MKAFFECIDPYTIHASGMQLSVTLLRDGVYRITEQFKVLGYMYPDFLQDGISWNSYGQFSESLAAEIGAQIFNMEKNSRKVLLESRDRFGT